MTPKELITAHWELWRSGHYPSVEKLLKGIESGLSELSEYSERTCEWKYDSAYEHYDTKCGQSHSFTDGNIEDNFCPYCGGKITEVGSEKN